MNKTLVAINALLIGFFASYLTSFRMLFSTDTGINFEGGFSLKVLIILSFIYSGLIFLTLLGYIKNSLMRKNLEFKNIFIKVLSFSSLSFAFLVTALFFKSKAIYIKFIEQRYSIDPILFNEVVILLFLSLIISVTTLTQYFFFKEHKIRNSFLKSVLIPQSVFWFSLIFISKITGFTIVLSFGIIRTLLHGF
ncbi:hypothetical protein HYU16_00535 [Candidatus Woesearchaeota archaeon]|nr:hypothetical protein [Candidatus Woesearchaeota archaeon]